MALKLCSKCGASISEQAQICPQCGAPNPTRENITATMVIAFVVATFGMVFLPGRPVPPVQPVQAVPHKEESLANKYANMDEQQLIGSLPEDYIKEISRQKFLVTAGIEPARTPREIVELIASSSTTEPDSKVSAIIDAMVKLEQQSGPYVHLQGNRYLDNKQYDLAIKKFDEAIRLGEMKSYHSRGIAWLGKQEYALAIADFTQAVKFRHESFSAYVHRAEANEKKGDHYAAIADYRRALVLAPDKARSDEIKATLKRLGYVENGFSAESDRAARRNRR